MKLVQSKQKDVKFSHCEDPMMIDKSKSWGKGNVQRFPGGAFLKHDETGEITHGVQPDPENPEVPLGWTLYKTKGDVKTYQKSAIWVDETTAYANGDKVKALKTKDGEMDYQVTDLSFKCFNDKDGEPDLSDPWIQKAAELVKNYEFTIQ